MIRKKGSPPRDKPKPDPRPLFPDKNDPAATDGSYLLDDSGIGIALNIDDSPELVRLRKINKILTKVIFGSIAVIIISLLIHFLA